eukprot:12724095-Prorocentrum_lima.AAC.1
MPGVADHVKSIQARLMPHIGGRLTVTGGTSVQDHTELLLGKGCSHGTLADMWGSSSCDV